VGVSVGVAYSRKKLALRRKVHMFTFIFILYIQIFECLKLVGGLRALKWAWQKFVGSIDRY